ncbi:hypothetical protein FI667_g9670, partial [Globisporangium splendens]
MDTALTLVKGAAHNVPSKFLKKTQDKDASKSKQTTGDNSSASASPNAKKVVCKEWNCSSEYQYVLRGTDIGIARTTSGSLWTDHSKFDIADH